MNKKVDIVLGMKELARIATALISAFILVNLILVFYERPVGWIDTPNGASLAVRNPNSVLVHGTEGYGISRIDENGYTNSGATLGDDYILMIGSSHTQGKEVPPDKKYSEIVNSYLEDGSGKRATYNIACDGFYLNDIIKHFNSAVSVFPDASCITIEIGSVDYSEAEIREGLNQPEQADTRCAEELFAALSTAEKLKNLVKETFPLISIVKSNWQSMKSDRGDNPPSEDQGKYKEAIHEVLSLIRSEYSGKIVFLYHPGTRIREDGSMELIYSEYIDLFREACGELSIDFIDVGERFLETYEEKQELPYGFQNTTLGEGHLNVNGHQCMADAIINYLNGAF